MNGKNPADLVSFGSSPGLLGSSYQTLNRRLREVKLYPGVRDPEPGKEFFFPLALEQQQ